MVARQSLVVNEAMGGRGSLNVNKYFYGFKDFTEPQTQIYVAAAPSNDRFEP